MQPNNESFQAGVPGSGGQVIGSSPQPVQQQPVYNNSQFQGGYSHQAGYVTDLKNILTNPKAYTGRDTSNLIKTIIFPVVNLLAMVIVLMATTIVSYLTNGYSFNGDFWGALFKNAGISSLYVILFILAITGVVMMVAIISKRDVKMNSVLSTMSVFSLNFLAVSIASIIGLLALWVKNVDFESFIFLINNLIVSIIFIYTTAIIIVEVIKITGLGLLKSTAVYVGSILLIMFLAGKIIKTFPFDMGISFGGYSNSSMNSNPSIPSALEDLNNSLNSIFEL